MSSGVTEVVVVTSFYTFSHSHLLVAAESNMKMFQHAFQSRTVLLFQACYKNKLNQSTCKDMEAIAQQLEIHYFSSPACVALICSVTVPTQSNAAHRTSTDPEHKIRSNHPSASKLQFNIATNFLLFDYLKKKKPFRISYSCCSNIFCADKRSAISALHTRRNTHILHAKRPILTKPGKCAKIPLTPPT